MALKFLTKRQTETVRRRSPFLLIASDLLAEEGCSGTTGQHKEAESKQEGIPPCDWDVDLSDPSKEHGNGNHARSEYSSDKGEHSPSRKCENGLRNENIKSYVRFMF